MVREIVNAIHEAKSDGEERLRVFQDELGLDRGGPNLYPGTAARIMADAFAEKMWELFDERNLRNP